MVEAQHIQLSVTEGGNKTGNSTTIPTTETSHFQPGHKSNTTRWLRIILYTVIGMTGTTSASLLTRLYYEKGGTSKWVGTLIQLVGFPILLPYYFIIKLRKPTTTTTATTAAVVETTKPPSTMTLACVYLYFGLIMAGNSYLFSVGFDYLPVSTVSLISSSQLAFNAFFSYFLNSQKFTPLIINSLFLLTLSSVILVTNIGSDKLPGIPDGKYVVGIICALVATSMNGLSLASQQMVFRKFLKQQSVKAVMDLAIYQSLVASILTSIGFFASGEWKGLRIEMDRFELGKGSYVNVLVWTAVGWQVAILCSIALVFELSALFANVIGALGVPIGPVAAMIVFHDKMSGVKGISMVLAVWGFFSYAYQQYEDEREAVGESDKDRVVSVSVSEP